MSLMSGLKKLLDYGLSGGLKKLLVGAGIGVGTTAISLTIINYYINKLVNSFQDLGNFANLGSVFISLLGLARVDVAISIIISAYVLRFTIKKSQLFLTRAKQ